MSGTMEHAGRRRGNRWRIARWSAAALLLLLPLIAMQFTDDVVWTASDFVVFGAMLLAAGIPYELAARKTGNAAYRAGAGVALAAAFFLVWVTVAVGIIGNERDDANVMYAGVLAVGILGALVARFEPEGMARALFATALAQASVGVIALVLRLGSPEDPQKTAVVNGFFVLLFAGSGWLFRKAARGRAEEPTA